MSPAQAYAGNTVAVVKNLLAILGRTHPSESSLSSYADGRLEAEQTARLEAHLAGCRACGLRLEGLTELRVALASLPDFELPRSYQLRAADVRRMAPVKGSRERAFTARAIPALAGMAIVALAVLVGADLRSSGGRASSNASAYRAQAPAAAQGAAPQAAMPSPDSTTAAADASKSLANTPQQQLDANASGATALAAGAPGAAAPANAQPPATAPEGTSGGAATSDFTDREARTTPPAATTANEAPETPASQPNPSQSGGGHDWLRMSEAGLAVTALALVVASVIAVRRRRGG